MWRLVRVLVFASLWISTVKADEVAQSTADRVRWTTSRVIGSPDPPSPFTVEPALTGREWKQLIHALAEPGTNRLFVVQNVAGEEPARVLVVDGDDANAEAAEVLLEIPKRSVYAIEFHPNYHENGYIYICSNGSWEGEGRANRVSRYTVTFGEKTTCDPDSELTVIEWRSHGHDGGGLVFGKDGMLYVTAGDGTSDSDTWLSAQDVTNLLGGVIRIDVDHPADGRPYSIPDDNPFLDVEGARGELFAFGLRNPWRLSIDARTGQIWIGNNGQDLWETAHLLVRGANYGWSVYEGNHPFYTNRQLGPAEFVPPTIEHHHREARSLTGGVVYYGEQLLALEGSYVYGDYSTGKIWAARHNGTEMLEHREIADTSLQIAGFALTHGGDLLVIDYAKGFFRIVPNPHRSQPSTFPRRLSETGLFSSTSAHVMADGVVPYNVNAPGWHDGASIERYMAVPDDDTVKYTGSRWSFGDGAVLMQTLSLPDDTTSWSMKRIETRILTKQNNEWAGYSYVWSDDQEDATLVDRDGMIVELDASGDDAPSVWTYPSRADCMSCHSRAANYVLGISTTQMYRMSDNDAGSRQQILELRDRGVLVDVPQPVVSYLEGAPSTEVAANEVGDAIRRPLVSPYDETQPANLRVRSYLHVNCSSCHVSAGGGNARMELAFPKPFKEMGLIDSLPQHDTFGIANARLVAAGDSDSSVLFQRISRRSRGQMPPLGTSHVDHAAVQLVNQWISQVSPTRKFVRDWGLDELKDDLSDALSTGRSFQQGRDAFHQIGCVQCHRFSEQGGGAGPILDGVGKRLSPHDILESIVDPSKKVDPKFAVAHIETADGKVLQGRVERETEDVILLRQSASLEAPVEILKSEIEDRMLLPISQMPVGLLNTLEREEIFNLLTYLVADGSKDNPAFTVEEEPKQQGDGEDETGSP